MPTSLALFLSATTPISLLIIVSPPQKPIPPVTSGNTRSYWFGAEQDGRPTGPTDVTEGSLNATPPDGDGEQSIGPHECRTVRDDVQVCTPVRREERRPNVSPAELALSKWARLPIPAPMVRTAPPRQRAGLVGLP